MQPAVNRSEVANPDFLPADCGETKPLPISLDAELKINLSLVTRILPKMTRRLLYNKYGRVHSCTVPALLLIRLIESSQGQKSWQKYCVSPRHCSSVCSPLAPLHGGPALRPRLRAGAPAGRGCAAAARCHPARPRQAEEGALTTCFRNRLFSVFPDGIHQISLSPGQPPGGR